MARHATPQHLRLVESQPSEATSRDETLSDDALMVLAQDGSHTAFEALILRHEAMVMGYATRFLGDAALGRDATQDVFLTLWAKRRRFRAQGKFKSFLLTYTHNACRVTARRQRSHVAKVAAFEDEPGTPSAVGTPLDTMLKNARSVRLQKWLRRLPDAQRQALILRYFNDLSISQIADITGRRPGTVKSDLSRGLARLCAWASTEESQ